MLPTVLARQLQKGIDDYLATTFPMTNPPFIGALEAMRDRKDFVYHEPFLSVRLPFRTVDTMPDCFHAVRPAFLPYVHQQKAFSRLTGDHPRSTLVATGTGSGKTECFLYPILEYCWRHQKEPGIKALILYPMNALASDQARRIAGLIWDNPSLRGKIVAGMYVGQGKHPSRSAHTGMGPNFVVTDRVTMLNRPPDILLTNYKMLDYLLLRPGDADLWASNTPETLRFIAVDELHTFDGAQGTDLACLLRRVKARLRTPEGFLCCVGTSATMGDEAQSGEILAYASKMFGEPFDPDAVVTEQRQTAEEFFRDSAPSDFTLPTAEQAAELSNLAERENQSAYLSAAERCWLSPEGADGGLFSEEGRLSLSRRLTVHGVIRASVAAMNREFRQGRAYHQAAWLLEQLKDAFPSLSAMGEERGAAALDALFALVSYARTGSAGHLRPFLTVQVQLWMRELTRLEALVTPEQPVFALARDLTGEQFSRYLPVVNCRDCGVTGWVSLLNERGNATMGKLETFYNRYFQTDDKIVMLFPFAHGDSLSGGDKAWLCPDCLQVKLDGDGICTCGGKMMEVVIPSARTTGSRKRRQYVCPFCGSRRGLSLMGFRSATEMSAVLSQLFASKFNDDKKTLAFSDSVQDAAHRAGFFNARTWRFGLRGSIQAYVQDGGAGLTLRAFQDGCPRYWHERLSDEDFVGAFLAPNMAWMQAYEELLKNRKLGQDDLSRKLVRDIKQRISYEILLEYGISAHIGRTLEKSSCSVLAFPSSDIQTVGEAVYHRAVNELGIHKTAPERFPQMVAGYVDILRRNGAFDDPVFYPFVRENGNTWFLSPEHSAAGASWMPGLQSGRNTPRFPARKKIDGRRNYGFDAPSDGNYTGWIASCCQEDFVEPSTFAFLSQMILEELEKQGTVNRLPSSPESIVYGLNRERVTVSKNVVQYRCEKCGSVYAAAAENGQFRENAPCPRNACGGFLRPAPSAGLDYYGKLFSHGDLARVNAREHTGLLEKEKRERLETDFKRGREDARVWDPNVLSCTPTLEMGIDIGDLSTVMLCGMPPTQAQFLQRTGRAGRKDGNALTLATASARPHDSYYYADPLDMMQGNVRPPMIFLQASAVLERQFLAFCMDSWAGGGIAETAIPSTVSECLSTLAGQSAGSFPWNLLDYIHSNLSRLLDGFYGLFTPELDEQTKEELRTFAQSGWENADTDSTNDEDKAKSSLRFRLIAAFQTMKEQRDALSGSIRDIRKLIQELRSKPKDSSFEQEIQELESERWALVSVIREMNQKNLFNFLSDEGLLPNYAFPEAGVVLKAILRRKTEAGQPTEKGERGGHPRKITYSYSRSADAAIREFAPGNSFYVDGRKLTIDQLDVSTTQAASWRLCPMCSYAELEVAGRHPASCPRCGETAWADTGQVRTMLKARMLYSNMDDAKSRIGDDSDDRANVFYLRQFLVDVDEQRDIVCAYRIDNAEFPFGYEFIRKAVLRDINFGERDITGEKLSVDGQEEIRKGFRVCRYCGKVQLSSRETHAPYCKGTRRPALSGQSFEECLFLYREFSTEILRLLIPATDMDTSEVRADSFAAAFMLGMREYFGNVDHLRAAVSSVPVRGGHYRRQYLVIYDSVPGGTGYLKQLLHSDTGLTDIFRKALDVLENCTCKEDKEKDGCYYCLFAYRQSDNMGSISRRTAIHLLRAILSGKKREKIQTVSGIPLNSLFESELERRFVEALRRSSRRERLVTVRSEPILGKQGYILTVRESAWEMEPQCTLNQSDGVAIPCKPDFVLRPMGKDGRRPVAVFTDGFFYHRDIAADDTAKRAAIRRSGRYRVWSLSWRDVQSAFQTQGDYATVTLDAARMPMGAKLYHPAIHAADAEELEPEKLSAIELLLFYLGNAKAETLFTSHAKARALSLLDMSLASNPLAFSQWNTLMSGAAEACGWEVFPFPGTICGSWTPRSVTPHLTVCAGVRVSALKENRDTPVAVCAVLDDASERRTDSYEREWGGFWQFSNLMQFLERFAAVSHTGLTSHAYEALPITRGEAFPEPSGDDLGWNAVWDLLFGQETLDMAEKLRARGIPAPSRDEIGMELQDASGRVCAMLELAWTEKRVGFMTEGQLQERAAAEGAGWTVFSSKEEPDERIWR